MNTYCPVAVQYLAGKGNYDGLEAIVLLVALVMAPSPHTILFCRLADSLVDNIWFLQMDVQGAPSSHRTLNVYTWVQSPGALRSSAFCRCALTNLK